MIKILKLLFRKNRTRDIKDAHHIRQHIPNFCDGTPIESIFYTTEELTNLDWVKRYTEHLKDYTFCKFSLSENHLMAEYNNGDKWIVVGTIDHPEFVYLPKWSK